MKTDTFTVRFEVHPGDARQLDFWLHAHTSITEVVTATIVGDGKWTVSVTSGDHHFMGEPAEYKNQAILNFLKARLGLSESGEKRGTQP